MSDGWRVVHMKSMFSNVRWVTIVVVLKNQNDDDDDDV